MLSLCKKLPALVAGLLLTHAASAQLYDVRTSSVQYNKNERPAVKVQIDGSAMNVRAYFQDWMKSSYNVRFRDGGVAGMGRKDVLSAKQVPASTISGKLVDLYATFIAPSDSVTEMALFGAFDENTFFDADKTPTEFNAMRSMVQNFASAARLKAYRELIEDAEKKLATAEKEKEKLEREVNTLKTNTAANLARMEELRLQNIQNRQQARQDSVLLITNASQRAASQVRLQRRRERLTALERK